MTAINPESQAGLDHSEQLSLYDLFVGMLTVISLGVMAMQFLLPRDAPAQEVLVIMDGLFCAIFMTDFVGRLWHAHPKMSYLKWQGITDFLGSIPAIPALRLFRLFRLARVGPHLAGRRAEAGDSRVCHPARRVGALRHGPAGAAGDHVRQRGRLCVRVARARTVISNQAATPPGGASSPSRRWATATASRRAPDGRLIGVITMIFGIGLFGVLTSVMASKFLTPPHQEESEMPATRGDVEGLLQELRELHARLDQLGSK